MGRDSSNMTTTLCPADIAWTRARDEKGWWTGADDECCDKCGESALDDGAIFGQTHGCAREGLCLACTRTKAKTSSTPVAIGGAPPPTYLELLTEVRGNVTPKAGASLGSTRANPNVPELPKSRFSRWQVEPPSPRSGRS